MMDGWMYCIYATCELFVLFCSFVLVWFSFPFTTYSSKKKKKKKNQHDNLENRPFLCYFLRKAPAKLKKALMDA